MTWYTPPEVRREVESFDIALSNPPFQAEQDRRSLTARILQAIAKLLRR